MLTPFVRLLAALTWLALFGQGSVVLAMEAAIVLSKRNDAQAAFAETLVSTLATVPGVRLGDAGTADGPLDEGMLKRADLVIAVGAEAADLMADRTTTVPVIAALISSQNLRALQLRHPKAKLGGFVLDQPWARHMRLIRAALPKAARVGVLLGPQSSALRSALAESAARQGLSASFEKIDDADDLLPALERLLENSDLILAVPDPVAYSPSTARPILLTTYRYRKPLFGYSQAYVTAGAIASVYTAPADAARQVSEWLASQQGNAAHPDLPPGEGPRHFSIAVNRHVARSLLLPLPDDSVLTEAVEKRRTP